MVLWSNVCRVQSVVIQMCSACKLQYDVPWFHVIPLIKSAGNVPRNVAMCTKKQGKRTLLSDINRDKNNTGFKVFKLNWLCECFMRTEMHLTCLLNLKDTLNVLGEKDNLNIFT